PPSTPPLFPYTTLFRSEPLIHKPQSHHVGDTYRLLPQRFLLIFYMPYLSASQGRASHIRFYDVQALSRLVHPAMHVKRLHSLHRDRKSTRLNSSHVSIS